MTNERNRFIRFIVVACALLTASQRGWNAELQAERKHPNNDTTGAFQCDIPNYPGNVILGRPSDRSITLSVLLFESAQVIVRYGPVGQIQKNETEPFKLQAGEPKEIILTDLQPDTAYGYRVVEAITGNPLLPKHREGSFHTYRPPGSSFVFTVQADSHLDESSVPQLYQICLRNVLADRPDFHIDLGDTFMTGKHQNRPSALQQYNAQRYYFGLIGYAVPTFWVLGNHDGEETQKRGATAADGLAVWSNAQRKRLFPNPIPDLFYSGNTERHPLAGSLQNYYAWEWGDALFVVLDPYWYSRSTRNGTALWNTTIGKSQYDWLAETLRNSIARFKFVFIHQLVGGVDQSGRGGTEAASLFEWGGREKDGRNTFAEYRLGWEQPIHSLLVETGVNIVFHGHDHFFAHQELDGVIYQLVPQPSHLNFRNHQAKAYGYRTGDFLPNSGHLRVAIGSAESQVEYIRAATPEMARRNIMNGDMAFRYVCVPPER